MIKIMSLLVYVFRFKMFPNQNTGHTTGRTGKFLPVVLLIFLSACEEVELVNKQDIKTPGEVVNIGTESAPAFVTTGDITPSLEANPPTGRARIPQSIIDSLYKSNAQRPLWRSGNNWSRQAAIAHQSLRTSWAHGLQPNNYLPRNLKRLGPWSVDKDISLTAGLIKYISDISYGRTRPDYSASANKLISGLRQPLWDRFLAGIEPQGYMYQRLKKGALKSLAQRGATTPNFGAMEVTMEQLRLKPAPDVQNSTRILVNIAAFDLQVWDKGRLALGSKVIVGQEGRDTPLGSDRIDSLKFSPDWTAPRSIVIRDLFPKLKQNPGSFDNFGMEVSVAGTKINDLVNYNWESVSPENVHMRQRPGKDNVLGGVRFTLGNSNAIYLHDTKNKGLYGKSERAASSGCVRVAKSKELAQWLLHKDGKPWTMDQVVEAMNRGETSYVKLEKPVPLEMIYYTAWIDGAGALSLSRDLYNKNTRLRTQLGLNRKSEQQRQ